jgi:DNA-binding NarL/FixJ family response regulator
LLGRERFAALLEEGRSMTMAGAVAASFAPPSATSDASASSNALDARTLSLSHREREVLRLVPGRTAKEIGETLFISESTVRTHIEHILNKLGLRNQKELIAYIYEHGLVG